jgi:SAM-dependent methyltransferase
MGNRHIDIIADFIDTFGLPPDLQGKKILDIGVWTGGTCLVLCALGAEVVGLEEVVKYSNTVNYLAKAFDLSQQLQCRSISLYSFDEHDVYDYILYSGVIYHVTDPVLSLRILFNALKDRGNIFVETFGTKTIDQAPPIAIVEGPSVIRGGNKENLSRGGWNYYIPCPKALYLWLDSVGFHDIKVGAVDQQRRIRAVATRTQHEDMLRAGLSRPGIR